MTFFTIKRPHVARVLVLLVVLFAIPACAPDEGTDTSDAPNDSDAAVAVTAEALPGSPCSRSSQCDDGNSCTVDLCLLGKCTNTTLINGTLCSDGNACTLLDTCRAGVCVGGSSLTCNDGNPCTVDACNPSTGLCGFSVGNAGTVCRASATPCDAAETCTGTSILCPADRLKPAGTVCRSPAGDCDQAEACNGSSPFCPSDGVKPKNSACPDDGNACTTDLCTGNSIACQHAAGNPGAVCRATAGVCDVQEVCTGTSTSCPANAFVAAGTVCRASASQCDAAESCTGTGAQCPANGGKPDGSACDDQNADTANDVCTGGNCQGTDLCGNATCAIPFDFCFETYCDHADGQCKTGAQLPDGTPCIDRNGDTNKVCMSGECVVPLDPCARVTCPAPKDGCTDVRCDPADGVCKDNPAPDGATCDDNDPNTTGDVCTNGMCTGQ